MTWESIMILSISGKVIRSGRPKITKELNEVPMWVFVNVHWTRTFWGNDSPCGGSVSSWRGTPSPHPSHLHKVVVTYIIKYKNTILPE